MRLARTVSGVLVSGTRMCGRLEVADAITDERYQTPQRVRVVSAGLVDEGIDLCEQAPVLRLVDDRRTHAARFAKGQPVS
jgi:hypothetical protein